MKRLSGGLVLLNLTAISLALTSGEVDITDAGVLEELTELRQFIDVNRDFSKGFKNLKPIMIEYRSSASKFNGITQANLSFNTDALHMSIGANTIQADGKLLVITINVVYEYTDYVGYTIKSAKLNAYETLADGDATFTGDVGIGGDLEVTGDISGDKISGNEIIENMTGYAFGSSELDCIYAGVVKNGNKITFVIFGTYTHTDNSAKTVGRFTIPSDVGAKLYPYTAGELSNVLSQNELCMFEDSSLTSVAKKVKVEMLKVSNVRLDINIRNISSAGFTENSTYIFRYEQTYLLSDNLISNE